jgi:hypothetical protein
LVPLWSAEKTPQSFGKRFPIFQPAFPDDKHTPPLLFQAGLIFSVADLISLKLGSPVFEP